MMETVKFAVCDSGGVVIQTGTAQKENLSFYGDIGVNLFLVEASIGDLIINGVVSGRNIGVEKEEKKKQINFWREIELVKPFEFCGILFDGNEKSERNIRWYVSMIVSGAQLPADLVWRDCDNTDHPVDAEFIVGMAAALTARGNAVYRRSWQMKSDIDSLLDVQSIINYNVGWGD